MQTTVTKWEKPHVNPDLLKDLHVTAHHQNWRLLTFLVLYIVAAYSAFAISQIIINPWGYLICLPFYIVAAASIYTDERLNNELLESDRSFFYREIVVGWR